MLRGGEKVKGLRGWIRERSLENFFLRFYCPRGRVNELSAAEKPKLSKFLQPGRAWRRGGGKRQKILKVAVGEKRCKSEELMQHFIYYFFPPFFQLLNSGEEFGEINESFKNFVVGGLPAANLHFAWKPSDCVIENFLSSNFVCLIKIFSLDILEVSNSCF